MNPDPVEQAPDTAMGMVYLASADTTATILQNGARTEQNMETVATTITTVICAQIIAKGQSQ